MNQSIQLGARIRHGRAAAQARNSLVIPQPESHGPRRLDRGPRIDLWIGKRKPGRHDANHLRLDAAEHDRTTDQPGIAAVSALPEPVRQQYHGCRTGSAILITEPASDGRRDAEHRGERRRGLGDADPLGLAAARERHRFGVVDGNSCERARTLGVVVIETARHPDAGRHVQTLGTVLQFNQSIGVGIGQRLQDDAFDHCEDGDVGGNGEGKR